MTLEDDLSRALAFKAFAENARGEDVVRRAMTLTFMTQADLARASGITQETLRRYSAGRRPTAAHVAALSWAVLRRYK